MWCAHENPRFYLFSDVIFFLCVFFSLSRWIRFKNKVRFSSFRASLRKSPSVLFFHFQPHIFSLPVSCWPFQIGGEREYVNVLCVSHTLMPPMSTHATSRIYFYFPCVFDAYGGRAHSKTSLAHPIVILACLCPFCVRFYSFRSTFLFLLCTPKHCREQGIKQKKNDRPERRRKMRREKNEVSHHIAIHTPSLLCTHRMVLWHHICSRRNHITSSEQWAYTKKKQTKKKKSSGHRWYPLVHTI